MNVDPEVVFHMLCASGHDGQAGVMVLTQVLDDSVGRQLRYVCSLCAIEITINFPPVTAAVALSAT